MRSVAMLGSMFVLVFSALFLCTTALGEGTYDLKDYVIDEGTYYSDVLWWVQKGSEVTVSVSVNLSYSNSRVDVYILNADEFDKYPLQQFHPAYVVENTASTTFTWTVPDDQTYYLVIDNQDNVRPSDAVPTGDVMVDISRSAPFSDMFNELDKSMENFMWVAIGAGVAVVVVIIVVIVIVVVAAGGKKRETPPYAPQQMQPHATQQYTYPCQRCGAPMRFVPEYQKWWCDHCQRYA